MVSEAPLPSRTNHGAGSEPVVPRLAAPAVKVGVLGPADGAAVELVPGAEEQRVGTQMLRPVGDDVVREVGAAAGGQPDEERRQQLEPARAEPRAEAAQ